MNTKKAQRPLPQPTETTRPFWNAANEHKLMLQYDPDSRCYQFYPRMTSVKTGKRNLEWRQASGKGTVFSFTDTYVPVAGFEDIAPYALVMIDLDEGVRILANYKNYKSEHMKIGQRVRVTWEKVSDDITMFAFEPDV
ncbi:MAG: DNA-binding protein [Alphaproteobacteria bacterium]|nr:DNA-binding protein [Alphaproteobacteria bacterium]